jgi:hypothetical protein
LLRPTIRKPGSELWFSWNPRNEKDPVDKFLRKEAPPGSIVVPVSWRDNPFVIGRQVYTKLQDHPEFIDRGKHAGQTNNTPAVTTKQAVAAILELDELLVMDGIPGDEPGEPEL